MKFGNVLVVWLLMIVAAVCVMVAGWGVAFAFAYNVFVPWLGVIPADYHNLAAFLSAFLFDGLGTLLVIVVLVLAGFASTALYRRIRARR